MDQALYFVGCGSREASRAAEEALGAMMRRVSPLRAARVRVGYETSVVRTLAKLRNGAADVLVLDARGEAGPPEDSACLAVLRALYDEHAVGAPIGRDRAWLVVGPDARGAALAFEAGRLRLAGCIVDEGVVSDGNGPSTWQVIWEHVATTIARGRGGKIALCLAGGGTEGLFYELGALRALAQFLPEYALSEVDVLCGISAGAVLGGFLANGLGPDELANGLKGGSSRIDPIRRSDLFDPAVGALAKRALTLTGEVVTGRRSPISALFRLPPAGVFAGARLRSYLERQLTKPGMSDRFGDLPRKLFIGATDQDSSEHRLFSAETTPHVPIDRAIRASTALAPFYAPEEIDGRFYVDGGFTRTTNMRVAVQQGATLVILVDPLVPVASMRPGHVAERGGVFVAMQGLKSLINGRFDKAVPTLRAMYPHVAVHLFQPGPEARRVMGGSPMKYFWREEIEEIAFRETVRDIRASRFSLLERDFARHNVEFVDPDAAAPSGAVVDAAFVA